MHKSKEIRQDCILGCLQGYTKGDQDCILGCLQGYTKGDQEGIKISVDKFLMSLFDESQGGGIQKMFTYVKAGKRDRAGVS